MENIVDQYSSLSSPFLLSIIKEPTGNTRKQYHNALTLINHNLKAIGKELGLTLPLTMYVARHSWASIARDEGIPISVSVKEWVMNLRVQYKYTLHHWKRR